ncbi:MAG TPA: hypothetical protein VFG79_06480 [Solirubrobacter sp.]|nr:hypothetical protein [Solirubrobacter sp.]
MPRLVASLLVIAAVLAGAAPARAARVTVTTAAGSAEPVFVTNYTRWADGPAMIGDGFPMTFPALVALPGEQASLTLDGPADTITARVGATPLAVAAVGDLAYTLTIPGDTTLPARVSVIVDDHTADWVRSSTYALDLVPAPPPPPPPPPSPVLPGLVEAAPEPPARIVRARLGGRRLSVAVACPATARSACAGRLTLKTRWLRIARLSFAEVPAGARRTLRTRIRPSAARHLRRHHVKRLRAVVSAPGRAAVVARLPLRR